MSDTDLQKEHDPTSKRKEELREKGQTLRSKDLSGALLLASAIIMLLFLSNIIKSRLEENFLQAYSGIATTVADQSQVFKILYHISLSSFLMLLPLFMLLMGAAFGSVFLLGGWNFSLKALKFNLNKINPATNLPRIFAKRMFIDVAKSSIKFCIIVGFFCYFVINNIEEILSLSYLNFNAASSAFYYLIHRFIIVTFMGIIVIVAIDVVSSYFSYQSQTKMSSQEIKDEHKDVEGNSEVKRKLRSMQMAIVKQKIPQMVPLASVVITNPTHYAVALRYREGIDKAPTVIAKGKGPIALYIRKLAIANSVPVYEEPPLARAVFFTCQTGGLINPGLYMAVAIVLTYINQLRRYQHGQGPLPVKSESLEIPTEFMFKE